MTKRVRPKKSELPNYPEILKKNLLWKRANSVEHDKRLRNSRYKYRYGITTADYDRMFQEQSGLCKICKSSETGRKQSNHFAVDHDHKTGKVRGLLCLGCNKGLSCFKDDLQLFEKAMEYIRKSYE